MCAFDSVQIISFWFKYSVCKMNTGYVYIYVMPIFYCLREDQSIIPNPLNLYWPSGVYLYSLDVISLV
jgi:hypothetical protein